MTVYKLVIPNTDTATRTAATPLTAEILYDYQTQTIFYGDGATLGGIELLSGVVEIIVDGTPLANRRTIHFDGDLVSGADDAGNAETDITISTGFTTLGDMLYYGTGGTAILARGTQDQVLISDDTDGVKWANVSITGDMLKSVYDPNDDGSVVLADDLDGSPPANYYYGTDGTGSKGFYLLPGAGGGGGVDSVNGFTGVVVLNTSHISESGNLYYTDARVQSNRLDEMAAPTVNVSFNNKKITNLATPTDPTDAARLQDITNLSLPLTSEGQIITHDGTNVLILPSPVSTGQFLVANVAVSGNFQWKTVTTTDINEGSNLYYTTTRVRSNRLDQMAGPQANINFNGRYLTNLGQPQIQTDSARLQELREIGLHQPAIHATAANIADIATADKPTVEAALDQILSSTPSISTNQRILVRAQTAQAENGIYYWNGTNLVRAADADGTFNEEYNPGHLISVLNGDTYENSVFILTSSLANVTPGVHAHEWEVISGSGAGGGASRLAQLDDVDSSADLATTGDILQRDGSFFRAFSLTLSRIQDVITTGQQNQYVLQYNSGFGDYRFAKVPTALNEFKFISGNYSLIAADLGFWIIVDTSAGNATISLPNGGFSVGWWCNALKEGSGDLIFTSPISIASKGTVLIADHCPSHITYQGGSTWRLIGDFS